MASAGCHCGPCETRPCDFRRSQKISPWARYPDIIARLYTSVSVNITAGTRLGRYEIRSKIGEGGMGEVYVAQDTELDRKIAIKLRSEKFSEDEDKLNPFEQEARVTSALDHPNILTIFDIGNHEGSAFIVAELLEGEELRDRLKHGEVPQCQMSQEESN
jgi:serine/threonine protein kinase